MGKYPKKKKRYASHCWCLPMCGSSHCQFCWLLVYFHSLFTTYWINDESYSPLSYSIGKLEIVLMSSRTALLSPVSKVFVLVLVVVQLFTYLVTAPAMDLLPDKPATCAQGPPWLSPSGSRFPQWQNGGIRASCPRPAGQLPW